MVFVKGWSSYSLHNSKTISSYTSLVGVIELCSIPFFICSSDNKNCIQPVATATFNSESEESLVSEDFKAAG